MKFQASLWIVAALLVVAAGIVYALSTHPSPALNTAGTVPVTSSSSPTVTQGPQLSAKPMESLSPDLTHTDAFEFLDPIPVGAKAPDVNTKTATGKSIRLSEFKGKKNLVLVFYQGSFCSVCGHQLSNIQENLSYFKQQDAEIIAISADDKIHAMQSVGEHGLTFNVVPDPDKKIIKQFGVANISKKGIAWPSLFVIDKKGVVQLSFASREGHRMHSNEILPVLSKLTGKSAPVMNYE